MNLWLPGMEGWEEGLGWEFGIDIFTLLYLKQITNKDLLNSTGNSAQCSVKTYIGKEFEKEEIHIYV